MYLRMSPERLEHLLSLVGPLIKKQDTQMRKSISAQDRLVLTLRFLASGESQQSLSFSFMGKCTVSNIISETCSAIYNSLKDEYIRTPKSKNDWLKISAEFENTWNYPHCIGSLDGKHIRIECPRMSGTLYYNYKGFFSIVLLAVICDSRYCFTLFDLGKYGSNNDSGILGNSEMGDLIASNSIKIPPASSHSNIDSLPFHLIGDEIFPLKTWLMRPYPGKLSEDQRIFNYRISRARRSIENTFGILAARWRIFYKPIRGNVSNVEKCMSLHNYLRLTDNASYCPAGFVDSVGASGQLREGDWRSEINDN